MVIKETQIEKNRHTSILVAYLLGIIMLHYVLHLGVLRDGILDHGTSYNDISLSYCGCSPENFRKTNFGDTSCTVLLLKNNYDQEQQSVLETRFSVNHQHSEALIRRCSSK